jgi:hypothetical protein
MGKKEIEVEKYQNCIITLSDGSVHVFTGKAFSKNGNEHRTIFKIEFSLPKPLDPGLKFATNEDLKGGD